MCTLVNKSSPHRGYVCVLALQEKKILFLFSPTIYSTFICASIIGGKLFIIVNKIDPHRTYALVNLVFKKKKKCFFFFFFRPVFTSPLYAGIGVNCLHNLWNTIFFWCFLWAKYLCISNKKMAYMGNIFLAMSVE